MGERLKGDLVSIVMSRQIFPPSKCVSIHWKLVHYYATDE